MDAGTVPVIMTRYMLSFNKKISYFGYSMYFHLSACDSELNDVNISIKL